MALSSNTSFGGGPLVFLSPRNKDKDGKKIKPYLSVGRVGEDGKIAQTDEQPNSVTGDLIRVEVKDRVFESGRVKETKKEGILYIRDNEAGETYRLGLTFAIAPLGLFNSLFALKEAGDFTGLVIEYYANRAGYDAFSLKQNDKQVKWAFELDALPAGKEIVDDEGNLVKRTYKARDAFFEQHLLEIAAIVNKASKNSDNESTEDSTPAESPTPAQEEKVVTAASIAKATKAQATVAATTKPAQAKSVATNKVAPKVAAKPVTVPDDSGDDDGDGTTLGSGRIPF